MNWIITCLKIQLYKKITNSIGDKTKAKIYQHWSVNISLMNHYNFVF